MSSLFSPDSAFAQILSRIGDLIILNLLYLLTCIPIFTIGAANAALYTVCFRMVRNREDGIVMPYFRAFRDNFKQATPIWLLFGLIGIPSFWGMIYFYTMESAVRYLFVIYLTVLMLVLFVGSYAFPLLSQFENTIRATLKNALILSLTYLPRTVLVAILNLLPWVLLLTVPYLFIQVSFLWFALYAAGAAYINAALLWKVFKPFFPEETE